MDRGQAIKILPLVTELRFPELIDTYVKIRTEEISKNMTNERDEVEFRMLQGRVQELQYLKSLKEIILQKSKEK